MPDLRYLDLGTTDAAFNLAAEQHVFDSLPRDKMYFMLWQNRSAVIIGKYQNTLAEINQPFVQAHGIQVVRRLSGGGAVYHDLGNLNFTFIADAGNLETLDMKLFCEPVLRTLAALGVQASVNGRNDMTINGQKFSGNSQYLRGGRIMHNGTLLFDSDLSVVTQALCVDPAKIQAKGLKSVRSRVTNIRPHLREDFPLSVFRAKLLENILRETPGEEYRFNKTDLAAIETLRRERYNTWEWNFGTSPDCTLLRRRRFEGCGTVEARLFIEHGLIASLQFLGDFFSADEPEELAAHFVGLRPEREAYAAALEGVDVSRYFLGLDREALLVLLSE